MKSLAIAASPGPAFSPDSPDLSLHHHQHRQRAWQLRPGLRLHADDVVDNQEGWVHGRCAEGLHLVLLLEGQLELRYGERLVTLDSGSAVSADAGDTPRAGQPQAVLMHLERADAFARRLRMGRYARRLSVCAGPQWLEHLQQASASAWPPAVDELLRGHLVMRHWRPGPRAIALAEQLVRPPSAAPLAQAIYMESRLLDLLGEALMPTAQEQAPGALPSCRPGLDPQQLQWLRDLREYLHNDEGGAVSVDALARALGTNANSLQALFRQAYGTTLFNFIRESRLQRARLALERDGISIKKAASLAGYTSAANFSTAFSRRFGITPKQAQRTAMV